ncbi:LOW QUALITY PROTEIN: WAT1-related protein At1g70260 [Actinidia eriantha]|uniref:LOW QUALITY PROTEIN: WAT1-related protein At1g70260 n=1 Tax=Actinidia eriantha TaxID=165200 RepID=UPI002583D771|nr:LOW QUALITY PROTEIN: WAT1-related protein At1g70260 [Actinidia eriantha]
MVAMRAMLEDVVPYVLMVAMEACTIALTILASTIMSRGMSPFVFVVYTNALASIILLSSSFLFCKHRTEEPLFTLPLLTRLFFLGFTGITIAQNLAFVGLSYSSPILACGMGNLIPTFSFLLSIILRNTKCDWRGLSNGAKLIGSCVSIIGAISITLYKGPVIRNKYSYSSSSHLLQLVPRFFVFSSTDEHWFLGGIFLAAASLAFSVWNIIQVGTVKQYPEVTKIASVYTLFGTIQTTIVSMIMERNPSTWRVKLDMELLVIILTAIFGSVIRSRVQIWCMKVKGPFYVPLFKPLGIPIASLCGCIFFARSFHYGSIMGAAIVGMGYYTVMWGLMREDETQTDHGAADLSDYDDKVPLLEGESQV